MSEGNGKSKIILPKGSESSVALVDDKTPKNRAWLAEQTRIPEHFWSDEAVRFVMAHTPEPMLWPNRIMIAIPLGELGYSRFWQMLMAQVKHLGWHMDQSLIVSNSGQYLPGAHNKMIAECLKRDDWDYMLWLEHDHEFPSNLLELVGHYTDPIVGGLYFNRVPEDPQPVVYNWNADRTAIRRLQPYEMYKLLEKPGLHTVDVVPMGCTAVRRDVLETWPNELPWFHAPGGQRRDTDQMSDDVWFCRQAQELGWPIKVDSRIIAKHYGLVAFDAGYYIAWVNKLKADGKTSPIGEDHIAI